MLSHAHAIQPRAARAARVLLTAAALLCLGACETAYYSAWEQLGVEKRDILVDRVEEARDAQEDAKVEFASALEEFSAVTGFDGGDLEALYDRMNDAFEDADDRAEAVQARIEAVERVGDALFSEWEAELEQYSDASLRRSSERQLRDTKRRYGQLVAAMWRAEGRIGPVLDAMRDRVLFLKHNLNARAVAALKGNLGEIRGDVAALIADMEAAIDESNRFLEQMEAG